jgi:exopolysaccharide production protein ExoZ
VLLPEAMSPPSARWLAWLAHRFELSRGGGSNNVRPMEGLRGFAVLLVFLVHYVTLVDPWITRASATQAIAKALHTMGNTGVDLFFVLSGYLIYGSLIARPQPFGRYMARRAERIYPTFLVVFATYVVLSFVFPAENKIPAPWTAGASYLLKNLLLLPGLFPIEPLITVAWSLSYEMFYYLVIPLLIGALGLRARSRPWRCILFGALAVAILALGAPLLGSHVRLIMFIGGIVLHEALASGRARAPGGLAAVAALAAGLLGTLLPMAGAGGYALKVGILCASFFTLCLACFARPEAWLPRAFSWMPLRWLGNMSYSYYLVHGLALKAGFMVVAAVLPASELGPLFFWALMALMFALTLVPSALLFLLVERPLSLAPKRQQDAVEQAVCASPAAAAGLLPAAPAARKVE